MLPWIVATALMGAIAAWLAIGTRIVGDDLPRHLAARARWWRRWAWPVAAGCAVTAVAGTIFVC